jgi:hypothetical protein
MDIAKRYVATIWSKETLVDEIPSRVLFANSRNIWGANDNALSTISALDEAKNQ